MLNIIDGDGLELAGIIPEDESIYEYDMKGEPTVAIPEDNLSIQAAFGIFDNIVK